MLSHRKTGSVLLNASKVFTEGNIDNRGFNRPFYKINTNEIPVELSRENMISSHVKISPLLWLHKK